MKKSTKLTKVKEFELPINLSEERGYFLASCPIWSDCYAQGETPEEAIAEITLVAESLIELYEKEGLIVPLKLITPTRTLGKTNIFKLPLLTST